MAVAPLSHSARDYVRAFDLTCIALWRDGRLGVSRNPTGAEEAWWCPAMAAGQIVNMLAVLSAVRKRITRGAPQPGPTKGRPPGAQFLLSTSYAFAWPQDKPLPKRCEPLPNSTRKGFLTLSPSKGLAPPNQTIITGLVRRNSVETCAS